MAMRSVGSPSALPGQLAVLGRHLWYGADPAVRFHVGRRPDDPAHRVVETYWVLPSAARARMLLPDAERPATIGAITNYRRLRNAPNRAARDALAALSRAGAPLSPVRLCLTVPTDAPGATASLPTDRIARELGERPLRASVGVRDAANGKATLQLVHVDGSPAGYAKVGWNPVTDHYVRTEAAALASLERSGRVRAPRVIAECDYAGHPVVVTEPLPAGVRAVLGSVAPPTSEEIFALCPVVRVDRIAATAQAGALQRRLAHHNDPLVVEVARQARTLLDGLLALRQSIPVTERWHGDLTPWNTARDDDGTLWVWDWESSEPDAAAGLDALHWSYSAHRRRARSVSDVDLAACTAEAGPHLAAAGLPRRTWGVIAQLYVATVAERSCALASAAGTWRHAWITPTKLASLMVEAREMARWP